MFREEIKALKARKAEVWAAFDAIEADPHATGDQILAAMLLMGRLESDIKILLAFERVAGPHMLQVTRH